MNSPRPPGRPVRTTDTLARIPDTPPSSWRSSRERSRRAAAAMFFALATLVLVAAPRRAEAICPLGGQPKNLRIFHYNVHGMPARPGDVDGNEDVYRISDTERMNAIADEILEDDPDVVVLNEVWQEDEGGKDTFLDRLGPIFRHQIRYVRGLTSDIYPSSNLNDAGLMILSKDPFIKFLQPVPTDTWGFHGFEACKTVNGACTDWGPLHANDEVAVHTYSHFTECSGTDCLAQKAVLMVRMQGNCPYTVAFTHSDAHDELDDQEARTAQLAAVKQLMLASLTTQQLDHEPIFFVGDINVDGNFAPSPHVPVPYRDGSGSSEYGVQFDADDPNASLGAEFFSCKQLGPNPVCNLSTHGKLLTDAWGFETSPDDFGQTNHATVNDSFDFNFAKNEGQRLDYVFHSNPIHPDFHTPNMCMQHITRDFKLTRPARSDHMALRADFNGTFPRCNPREKHSGDNPTGHQSGSERVYFDSTGNTTFEDASTKLAFPGSNQWYIVKDKGTFSVAITDTNSQSAKIGAAVYHHSDLSREKPSFHKQTSTWTPEGWKGPALTALKYTFDDPPYYVRVYGMQNAALGPNDAGFHKPDRSFPSTAGGKSYKAHFHLSKCASFDDACALSAGATMPMQWPIQALNTYDQAYFLFYADAAKNSGTGDTEFPAINFMFRPITSGDPNLLFTTDGVRFYDGDDYNAAHLDCGFGPAPCNPHLVDVIQPNNWTPWTQGNGQNTWPERHGPVETGALPPDTLGTPKKYLLKLGRPAVTSFLEELRYETSLTYFLPESGDKSMTCHIQQSIMYNDQVGLRATFDTGAPRTDCSLSTCPLLAVPTNTTTTYVGEFDDEGTPHMLGPGVGGPFTAFVLPSLYEDVLNGSDYEYLIFGRNVTSDPVDITVGLGEEATSDDAKILPLSPTVGGDVADTEQAVFTWCGEQGGSNVPASESESSALWNCRNSEFWYTMGYQLTHDDQRK